MAIATQVGERHLARLVDEEVVEAAASKSGSANSHAVPATSWAPGRRDLCVGVDILDVPARRTFDSGSLADDFFTPVNVEPIAAAARFSTASSRLWIDLVAVRRHAHALARAQQLRR